MVKTYSCDWGFEEDKFLFFDGKKILKKPSFEKGDVVVTENIPNRLVKKLLEDGIEIYRIHANLIKEYRESLSIEKSDEADAKLIYAYYQQHPETFRRYNGESKLNNLYATFKEIQKLRVSTGNRLFANDDDSNELTLSSLEQLEKDIVKEMNKELEKYPIWQWLKQIKGINTATASGLIAFTKDISRFKYVSNLWSYYGLQVIKGEAPKKRKGNTCNWHQKGRSLILGVIGDNFIKQRTPIYREIYDQDKEKQMQIKGMTKLHAHRRAIRKMMKIFVSHYWVLDRQLHDLPTMPLYVHDKLKHNTYIQPPHIPEQLLPFNPIKFNHIAIEIHPMDMNQEKIETQAHVVNHF